MVKMKLTDRGIRCLQVPEGAKNVQVFDEELSGFGIRKFASGKATFFVKLSIGAQQRRKTLGRFVPGTLAEVRKEAKVALAQAALGKDVVGEAKKAAEEAKKASQVKTLGELVPVYLRVREFGNEMWPKLRPKSLTEATRYLEKAWLPLHCAPVDQITRKMVRDRRDEIISESGAMSANRAHAALNVFYSWAIDREHVAGANPTADIKHLKVNERTRVLSKAELVDIWQACGDGRIVKMLMSTGRRRLEIGNLEWREISVEKRQISLPEARVNNKQSHLVPLAPAAMELLEGLPSDGK